MGAWNNIPTLPAAHIPSASELKTMTDLAQVTAETYYIRKPSDQQVNNSATLVNDTDLILPVVATAEYEVHCHVFMSSAAAPDMKFQWTVPAGATITWGVISNNNAFLKATSGLLAIATDNTSGDEHCILTGVLVVSATPGNLQLQWAQNSATVANTIVRANSFLRLTRVA